jgi:hypothetical protein
LVVEDFSEDLLFDPCGIGGLMYYQKIILEELIQELQADRIATLEELEKAWKQKVNELKKKVQFLDCMD